MVALIAALVGSLYIAFVGRAEPGWTLTWRDELATVVAVATDGRADRLGIRASDVVVALDSGLSGSSFPRSVDIPALNGGDFWQASVMTVENALATRATGAVHDYVGTLSLDVRSRVWSALLLVLLTAAVGLTLLWQIARRQPGGQPTRRLALPLAAATVCPPLLILGWQIGSPPLIAMTFWLGTFAAVPLALGLVTDLERRSLRLSAIGAVIAGGAAGGASGIAALFAHQAPLSLTATSLAVGATTAVPGMIAALNRRSNPDRLAADVGSLELAVIGLTPLVAWISVSASPDISVNVWPLVAWVIVVVVGSRLTIWPLVGAVMRSRSQRDAIVAAMEAERSRLAADIHDDALQDLTMIVQRLDATGDATSADAVRGVADRLRAICYDLRLPILDDLGAGPALEWLVDRIERVAEADIRLELRDQRRPPPEVELAVFRVAQEALANAVKHGSPPIVVRYESDATGVGLSVEDSGPGMPATSPDPILAAAHFGMVAMQQRAEQIGAVLRVSAWPGRGTEITLRWKA
jgi:signal transduction histidine kinase